MADIVYNRFKANILKKLVDLATGGDTVRCALLSSSYTPNKDHNQWSQVSSYEITGTGYVAGGEALANQDVSQDDTDDEAVFDADDVTWTSSTITARYALLYDDTLANDDLICCIDFGVDKSSENGTFKIQWNAEGILNIA